MKEEKEGRAWLYKFIEGEDEEGKQQVGVENKKEGKSKKKKKYEKYKERERGRTFTDILFKPLNCLKE